MNIMQKLCNMCFNAKMISIEMIPVPGIMGSMDKGEWWIR
jgi:hypothetical protein